MTDDIKRDGFLDKYEHRLCYTESLAQQKKSAPELVKAHYAALTEVLKAAMSVNAPAPVPAAAPAPAPAAGGDENKSDSAAAEGGDAKPASPPASNPASNPANTKITDVIARFDTLIPLVTERVVATLSTNQEYGIARADKIFRAMDCDNDGRVSAKDFQKFYGATTSGVQGLEVMFYIMDAIEKVSFPGKRL